MLFKKSKKVYNATMKKFELETILYGIAVSVVFEICSLAVIGPNKLFALGLAVGTLVACIGFIILANMGKAILALKMSIPMVISYIIRMLGYGAVFLICVKISYPCGAGCAIGFTCIPIGLVLLYGFVYRVIKKVKNPLNDWDEPKEWNDLSEYDEEDDWK